MSLLLSRSSFVPNGGVQGEPVQDPFRRGIGHAIQWYDTLRQRLEAMVESAINNAHSRIAVAEATTVQRCPLPSEFLRIVNFVPNLVS